MSRLQRFVSFIREWCQDDSRGYSQLRRWGPDCDCSSLVYMAAQAAGYAVPSVDPRNTRTIRTHFTKAGFGCHRFNGSISGFPTGSLFLSEGNHVETYIGNDLFAGARIDEHGGITGCCSGDQTGNEISITSIYIPAYGWDYVLVPPHEGNSSSTIATSELSLPRYQVETADDGWLSSVRGFVCENGCSDDFAGIRGKAIIGLKIDWGNGDGWFQLRTTDHPEGLPRNAEGDGSPVCGITVFYETPDPERTGYHKAKYRVSPIEEDYLKWEYDDEDDYAGDGSTPIDRLQLTLCAA